MGKMTITAGLQGLINTNRNRVTMADLFNQTVTSANESSYGVNCIITIPDQETINNNPGILGIDDFVANGRTLKAPFIFCDSTEGPKKLYINQLIRNIFEYKESCF